MASMQFNASQKRRVPINRNSLFYSPESFEFDLEIAKDYMFSDMHQMVVLYQVDYKNTNQDAVYGETTSSQVEYKTPIEINCVYTIEAPELKSYDSTKNLGTYQRTGKLTMTVCKDTLAELGVDIKKGDYIGVQVNPEEMVFWVVTNDGKNNYDNEHTIFGTTSPWLTVSCAPVDKSEFVA